MLRASKYKHELISDKIIKIFIFENTEIDELDIAEMKMINRKLVPQGKYALMICASDPFQITSEARKLSTSKDFSADRIALALVSDSSANKFLGNFFINFNKPVNPTKIFTDEVEAIGWLNKEIEKTVSKT